MKKRLHRIFVCTAVVLAADLVTHVCAQDFAIVCADDEMVFTADEQASPDLLDRAVQAQKTTIERLKTVHAAGTYEVFSKGEGDQTEKLMAKADLEFFCDNGKFSINLMVTQGHRAQLVRYTQIVALHDGKDLYVVRYSPNIRPTGCEGDIYSNLKRVLPRAGFDLQNVYAPWQRVIHVDKLVENLGSDAITVTRLPDQVVRFSFNMKNSPSRMEFDVSAKVDFNVTGSRSFRSDYSPPVHSFDAKWSLANGVWYVDTLTEVWDWRFRHDPLQRSVVTFQKFAANPKTQADKFKLSSFAIPPGTRFIDRRENAAQRFNYFDGQSLSTSRL